MDLFSSRKLIKYWIKKYKQLLELIDWDVDFEINWKLDTQVCFNLNSKIALIIINNKDLLYLEYWVLHEMLHLKYPDKKEDEINEEIKKYNIENNL